MNLKKIKDSKSQFEEFKKVVTDIAENEGYTTLFFNNTEIEFAKYTDFGQDFAAEVSISETESDSFLDLGLALLESLYFYIDYFDPEEEAIKWSEVADYDDEGNEIREGKNGAPEKFEDIVDDMRDAKEDLELLYNALEEGIKKYSTSKGYK